VITYSFTRRRTDENITLCDCLQLARLRYCSLQAADSVWTFVVRGYRQ